MSARYSARELPEALGCLDEGHLIYAKGLEGERTHLVKGTRVRLIAHTLDLDVPPSNLLAQVARMARVMRPPNSHTEGDERHNQRVHRTS